MLQYSIKAAIRASNRMYDKRVSRCPTEPKIKRRQLKRELFKQQMEYLIEQSVFLEQEKWPSSPIKYLFWPNEAKQS